MKKRKKEAERADGTPRNEEGQQGCGGGTRVEGQSE